MNKKNKKQYIVFDINSSSVGALVFERIFNTKDKKYLYNEIYSIREDIIHKQYFSVENFFEKTLSTFQTVAEKSQLHLSGEIADIYINLAAPWSSSQKRILHFAKEEEFIFSKEIESEILEKENKELIHHTRDFREYKNLSVVEHKILGYFANGYSTKKPYGKKVKDVDIHSFISVVSTKTRKSFQHVIEKTFNREAIMFSNIFMLYDTFGRVFTKEKAVISIDVSGELSEIFVSIDHELKKIGTIPVGSNHIIRELSDKLNISFSKSKSLIQMFQEGHLQNKYKKELEVKMKQSFIFWFKHFYNFLDDVSKEYVVPDTLSLLAPEYIQEWLGGHILRAEELGEHMHAKKNISLLDIKMLWRTSKKSELFNIKDDNLAMCLDYLENFIDTRQK